MSDTTDMHIIAVRLRIRDLELEACAVKARYDEARAMLDMLEHPRRPRGRPRKDANILEMPPRMDDGTATPEPDSAA